MIAPVQTPEELRRPGAPPRRRRRNPVLALLRPLAVSLLLVAMPAGLVTWVLASPRFDLRNVEVSGTPRVSVEALRASVAPFEGGNLVLLPLASVEEAVRRNPWVDTVEVAKELPDRLHVEVTERRPVALLVRSTGGGGLVYADQKGRPIAPVDDPERARKAGLVVVTFAHPQLSVSGGGDGVGGALEVAGELGRVQPSWAGALSKIEVLGEQDFRLHTGSLRFPLLVTRGQVGPKVKRLTELLPQLDRRYPAIQAVDLRFSRRIVVQPEAS